MSEYEVLGIILMCVAVGAASGYIGSLMLSKRMSLVGGPLGHMTLPGITLALLYGIDVSVGAFVFLLAGIVLIWLIEKRTRLPLEAVTAVVFTSSLAIAFLFLPEDDFSIALLGDISQVSLSAILVTILLSFTVIVVIGRKYVDMVMVTISEEIARVRDIKVDYCNLLFLLGIAVVVALGVRVIGGLMTAALVSIPAATSRNITRDLRSYALISMLVGALSCGIGVICFLTLDVPAGQFVILSSAAMFVMSLVYKAIIADD